MEKPYYDFLKKIVYRNAKKKGLWSSISAEDSAMRIVSEASEALNAKNSAKNLDLYKFLLEKENLPFHQNSFERHVKNSFGDELADVIIMTLSLMGHRNFQFAPKNLSAIEILDFKRKTTTQQLRIIMEYSIRATKLFECGAYAPHYMDYQLSTIIRLTELIAEDTGINLHWHIIQKIQYNKVRKYSYEKRN